MDETEEYLSCKLVIINHFLDKLSNANLIKLIEKSVPLKVTILKNIWTYINARYKIFILITNFWH